MRLYLPPNRMVIVAQLVRAPVCGSGGRGFETHLSPFKKSPAVMQGFFRLYLSVLASPTSVNQSDWLNVGSF
jgi:hypothetical protein